MRPDSYIDLDRFSDLDSLFELHGHLRAANPDSPVTLRSDCDHERALHVLAEGFGAFVRGLTPLRSRRTG
ncbi:hypothetical protein [Streptosporangium sp. NPDC001681]|uniref:hypothetical protein n=1 Tax=Streptosporangium sp. NPDC001681 TaxID=3154395 RepID=UPI003322B8A6